MAQDGGSNRRIHRDIRSSEAPIIGSGSYMQVSNPVLAPQITNKKGELNG